MRALFSALLLSFLASFGSHAQDNFLSDSTTVELQFKRHSVPQPDSTAVELRAFDQTKVEQLKRNDDFDYKEPPSVAESLWSRFLQWLYKFFEWLFRGAAGTNWGRVILYALGFVLVISIIMMLLKVDALRVFYRGSDTGSLNYQTLQENIHEMDFEKLIREALERKEYRIGIRLTFLYALKLLSDKHHVDWRPGKTNHDYVLELKDAELKTGFNELSFYFDYAWYGEFTVNEGLYYRVSTIFESWRNKVA